MPMPLTCPARAGLMLGARISHAHRQCLRNLLSYSAPSYLHDKQRVSKNLSIFLVGTLSDSSLLSLSFETKRLDLGLLTRML